MLRICVVLLQPTHPFQLVLGLILWALWFVLMYAGLSVVCETAAPAQEQGPLTWLSTGLVLLTILTLFLLLFLAQRCWRSHRRLRRAALDTKVPETETETNGQATANKQDQQRVASVATLAYLASAVAVLLAILPLSLLPPCV